MNIAVTIFYALAGTWLVVLTIVAIVKRRKLKKQQKELEKELENEIENKQDDSKTEK